MYRNRFSVLLFVVISDCVCIVNTVTEDTGVLNVCLFVADSSVNVQVPNILVCIFLRNIYVSCTLCKMYCGHPRLCVCLSVCLSAAACPHYCTDEDVTWRSGRECPRVVHCWADLQSVHGLRCCSNTMELRGRAQR